ncbi:MAG: formate dehydrogenase accessory protein FdhE [Rhodanobacteraceae bacterium]
MAQRILEPGQIETLAARSIPRVRLPDRTRVFRDRAARLRTLASDHAIGGYLELIARLCDAQHAALSKHAPSPPATEAIERSAMHGMPPLPASGARDDAWRTLLAELLDALAPHAAPVADLAQRLRGAQPEWLDAQADAVLAARTDLVDLGAAPFVMAALQVHWAAMTEFFDAGQFLAIDATGVCPLCGSLPVASIVHAQSPYQGYRYLHCSLCASEWHRVRIHCTGCDAAGKDIGYQTLTREGERDDGNARIRAESCEQCHGYRKIVYREKDPSVEPVADDLASLALDVLMSEHGYHRLSANPLLWQRSGD